MSLIDAVEEYTEFKDDKKLFLNQLDIRLKDLEKSKPDYRLVAEKIVKSLEQRTNIFLDSELYYDSKDFKVGDHVIGVGTYEGKIINGLKGKVVLSSLLSSHYLGVEWEKDIGGHNCNGHAKKGYGWNVRREHVKNVSEVKLAEKVKTREDYKGFTNRLVKRLIDASKKHSDFKVGDKVKIRKDSPYFEKEGKHGLATIIREMKGQINKFRLEFKDDYNNTYRPLDIELVNPPEKFNREKVQRLINNVVSSVESELGVKDYELRRDELIKQGVSKLKSFKFNDSQIIDFFKKRLSTVSDVKSLIE